MQVIVTGGPSYEPIDQVRRLTNFSTGELGGMRVPISVDGQKRQWVRLDTGCATAFQWVTSLGLLAVRKLVILHTARIYLRDFSCCGVSKDVNKRRNQPPTKRRNLANEPWRFQQVQIAPLK